MGSTQAEVEVSYDVSNEFFRLWLDERMNYTCGIFDEPEENWHTNNLEEAQVRKLEWHHKKARLSPEKRLLDIGCGWGANLEYQAVNKGVKECHGITLSRAQHDEIMKRKIPGVTASVVSYADYQPTVKFDGVISICMMEHIASPSRRAPASTSISIASTSASRTSGRTRARTSRCRPSCATASRARARRSRTSGSARTRSSRAD